MDKVDKKNLMQIQVSNKMWISQKGGQGSEMLIAQIAVLLDKMLSVGQISFCKIR